MGERAWWLRRLLYQLDSLVASTKYQARLTAAQGCGFDLLKEHKRNTLLGEAKGACFLQLHALR